jgi:hypothetical protein
MPKLAYLQRAVEAAPPRKRSDRGLVNGGLLILGVALIIFGLALKALLGV